jgi:hypothetical protein
MFMHPSLIIMIISCVLSLFLAIGGGVCSGMTDGWNTDKDLKDIGHPGCYVLGGLSALTSCICCCAGVVAIIVSIRRR